MDGLQSSVFGAFPKFTFLYLIIIIAHHAILKSDYRILYYYNERSFDSNVIESVCVCVCRIVSSLDGITSFL